MRLSRVCTFKQGSTTRPSAPRLNQLPLHHHQSPLHPPHPHPTDHLDLCQRIQLLLRSRGSAGCERTAGGGVQRVHGVADRRAPSDRAHIGADACVLVCARVGECWVGRRWLDWLVADLQLHGCLLFGFVNACVPSHHPNKHHNKRTLAGCKHDPVPLGWHGAWVCAPGPSPPAASDGADHRAPLDTCRRRFLRCALPLDAGERCRSVARSAGGRVGAERSLTCRR